MIPFFDDREIRRVLSFGRAMDAIDEALLGDVDPEGDAPRLFSPAPDGEFLIMPATGTRYSGVKALTVAPRNPARGLEKIQGVYILYASDSLAPVAVMEGATLTAVRTPATTMCAVRALARLAPAGNPFPERPRVLVFGAGTQAHGLIRASRDAFPLAHVEVIGRDPQRVGALQRAMSDAGVEVADRTGDRSRAVSDADVIICATTSEVPLFDGALVQDGAIVAAIGTHGLNRRELDEHLVARADLVVEGRTSARTENGNVVSELSDDRWRSRPANLKDLIGGRFTWTSGRPAVYTGVGMSWEDLVCATVVFEESTRS